MDQLFIALGFIQFIVWIASMGKWLHDGAPVPKQVHKFALGMFIVGCGCLLFMAFWAPLLFNYKLVLFFLIGLPAFTYIGWIWILGASQPEEKQGEMKGKRKGAKNAKA